MITKIVVTLITALIVSGLIVYAAWAAYKVGHMRGWDDAVIFIRDKYAPENREAYPEFYEPQQENREKDT